MKNKLRGTLNHQNSLVVSNALNIYDVKDHRSLENLLFQNEDRVACTIVPKVRMLLQKFQDLRSPFSTANCEPFTMDGISEGPEEFPHLYQIVKTSLKTS